MARPRTFSEGDVMDAARDQFWSGGYAATSVDDLTQATGLGKGSLYGAFGDKHALFVRALEQYSGDAVTRIRAQLNEPGVSAGDRLANHINAVAADIAADSERRGCMIAKSSAELGAADADVDRLVQRSLTVWRAELIEVIKAAQLQGVIASQRDPQALATVVLALLRGFEALRKGGAGPRQIRAAAAEALALVLPGRDAE